MRPTRYSKEQFCKSQWRCHHRKIMRLVGLIFVHWALNVASSRVCIAEGPLSGMAVTAPEMAQVRDAVREVARLTKGRALLEEIAGIQIALGDIPGSLDTVELLNQNHADWRDHDVLPKVAAAQAAEGNLSDALRTAESLEQKWRHRCFIAIASAQVTAGNNKASLNTLSIALKLARGIENDYERTQILPQIAELQASAGETSAAKATLIEAERATETTNDGPFITAAAWRRIAIARFALHDRRGAQQSMQRAIDNAEKIEGPLGRANRAGALRQIALAWANAGEFALSCRVAELIPAPKDGEMLWTRGEAFYELAQAQIRADDLKGALESAREAVPVNDWKNSLLVQISMLQAEKGDQESARSTANQITDNNSRRAEAMLRIATVLAKSRNNVAVREIVDSLPKMKTWFIGDAFDLNRPDTWAREYEYRGFSTNAIRHANAKYAGDLAAAAMGFHLATRKDVNADFAKSFHELKFSIIRPSKLRKISAAQSEAGDVSGALSWIGKLDSIKEVPDYVSGDEDRREFWKQIVVQNRIQARLGVADGVLRRIETTTR